MRSEGRGARAAHLDVTILQQGLDGAGQVELVGPVVLLEAAGVEALRQGGHLGGWWGEGEE